MTNFNETDIPEELLRSEHKQNPPASIDRPGSLGLPALPSNIIDLAIQHGPLLVLAVAVFSGFNAVSLFIGLSSADLPQTNSLLPLCTLLSLGASITMILAYIWLTQKRRIGWNMLAIALMVEFLSQILLTGVSSILFTGIAILITTYVMLQLRDSYSQ